MIRFDFSGRVALVIGGSSGIGLASARGFTRAGACVAIAARGENAGREACAALLAEGARVLFVPTDVREEAAVSRAVEETVKHFGRLDFAVNCAGGGDMAPLDATDQGVWDDVMAVNARGVWLAMRHEIPAMIASGGGSIVNISSIFGMAGRPAQHAYVASKHAVIGMTRSVALEYATRGIRVNAICAGVTATPSMRQFETFAPEIVQNLVAQHPMSRMATEEEIAGAVLWLCSDSAGYVTGAPLPVDGGFLAA
ncbi:SDR family NAD(P)-dependent oxidoreductase [Polyangium sorediatum]|uniref:SDR family oxidoreductase n=1 Tax=Polyangium sorediatum TaxID=889274 RepID=A0ABT6NJW0_9BACT|nr:SDR family oxidoreductase [Polyangium sorediatum]MDI1428578.1 SDR family oxidoreductase [Polyangium sorediatum]